MRSMKMIKQINKVRESSDAKGTKSHRERN